MRETGFASRRHQSDEECDNAQQGDDRSDWIKPRIRAIAKSCRELRSFDVRDDTRRLACVRSPDLRSRCSSVIGQGAPLRERDRRRPPDETNGQVDHPKSALAARFAEPH